MKPIETWIKSLFARKLVIAFLVGFLGALVDAVSGLAQTAEPITTSLIVAVIVGALAAAARAVLALSPLNIVPSDAMHGLGKPKPSTAGPFGTGTSSVSETIGTPGSFGHTASGSTTGQVAVVFPPAGSAKSPVYARKIAEKPGRGRLGRHVEHDQRSRDFAVAESIAPLWKVQWTRYGTVLDQRDLGSCTGNATAGLLNTGPFREARKGKLLTEKDALAIYELATTLDSIGGQYPPTDSGSSGLAAAKSAVKLGYAGPTYRHAFSLAQALTALQSGPVITGVNWYEGFDSPNKQGLVEISGQVRGGHEFEIVGYDPATGLVEAVNSWGASWGAKGHFFFTTQTWAQLLGERGDVTVLEPLA